MAEHTKEKKERAYDKKTVSIRRVAKVTKGSKRLRFSAMVVVGDHNGSVGVGLGRGLDTRSAVETITQCWIRESMLEQPL